jgi:hypothetical protein
MQRYALVAPLEIAEVWISGDTPAVYSPALALTDLLVARSTLPL